MWLNFTSARSSSTALAMIFCPSRRRSTSSSETSRGATQLAVRDARDAVMRERASSLTAHGGPASWKKGKRVRRDFTWR